MVGGLLHAPLIAQESGSREYRVKAAFLYNFAKFVDWPDEAFEQTDDGIALCVIGEDPFDAALDTIAGKTVRGRMLTIHTLESADDLTPCHVAFLSPSEKERLPDLFVALRDRHVLTVSDINDFARLGGIIGLVNVGNKVRFEINLRAAQRAGLSISSNLLRLARIVENGA